MYVIEYQWSSPTPLAYFNDYGVAKKCFDKLKERYPDALIYLNTITPITHFGEFMDKTGGVIREYELKQIK
jgi:hypothetical protein